MSIKLEYFPINGRALEIKLLLNYCNVEFEDVQLSFPEFGANAKAGKYTYG